MNYYNNSLDFLGKPILKNNKIFKTSQNRINYYNTDVNKINNIYPKQNYKNNHLYQISTSIPLFNLKENSYRRYHQSLNKDSVKEAYKCGTNHIDDSQDVFVIFNFGDTRCTISLTKDVFGIVSKEINIK